MHMNECTIIFVVYIPNLKCMYQVNDSRQFMGNYNNENWFNLLQKVML